jgi:hypothetical protein
MADDSPSTRQVDLVIELFNARKMDLPDGFFDRKTQFVLNGAPFETLLGQSPTDPLILMLTRGPAGFRFTTKALQHAIPDARVERLPKPHLALRLTGTLRGVNEAIDTVIDIALRSNDGGAVAVAEALMDETVLDKIRQARLRP